MDFPTKIKLFYICMASNMPAFEHAIVQCGAEKNAIRLRIHILWNQAVEGEGERNSE